MPKGVRFLLRYTWKYDKLYPACLLLYQLTFSLSEIFIMYMPKVLIDDVLGSAGVQSIIWKIVGFAFLIFALQSTSVWLKNRAFIERCVVFEKYQKELAEKLTNADYENLENPEFLDMKQNAEKFLYANGHGFSFVLDRAMNILGKVILFGTILWILGSLNIWVLLAFLLLSGLNSWSQMKLKKKYAELELERIPLEREGSYFNQIFSEVKYGKEFRINSSPSFFIGKLEVILRKLREFYQRQRNLLTRSEVQTNLCEFIQRACFYGCMAASLYMGDITISDFTLYINAISTFTRSMNGVIDSINDIRQYSIYFESVEKYMNLPSRIMEKKENGLIAGKPHTLEFRNVSFKYEGADAYALKNISCKFSFPEKIAIVGENGAGKSTFVKLICRLYDPTEGEILLDGRSIKDYDYHEYQQLLSAIFQDYQLFSIPISENLALGKPFDEAKGHELFDELGLNQALSKLPQGFHTRVHKEFDINGFKPSGGQGQKIAIARSAYRNTPIIILDEPTAALDPKSEYEIYQIFDQLVHDKLSFYISHRLASTRFCDQILVFDNGQIIEQGSHEDLMRTHSVYHDLFVMQSSLYVDTPAGEPAQASA